MESGYPEKKVIFKTSQVLWYILGLIEILLGFRFVFKLFGANAGSPFVRLIYGLTDGMTWPFRGIFRIVEVSGAVFDWSTLVAMAVYAAIAYGLARLLQIIKPISPEELERKEVENG